DSWKGRLLTRAIAHQGGRLRMRGLVGPTPGHCMYFELFQIQAVIQAAPLTHGLGRKDHRIALEQEAALDHGSHIAGVMENRMSMVPSAIRGTHRGAVDVLRQSESPAEEVQVVDLQGRESRRPFAQVCGASRSRPLRWRVVKASAAS